MRTLFRVELRRVLRDPGYLCGNLIIPVGMCLLLSLRYSPPVPDGVDPTTYLAVSIALFSSVSAALNSTGLRILKERHTGWTTRLGLTPLPAHRYLLLKLGVGAVSCLLPVLLIPGLIAGVMGTRVPCTAFLLSLLTAWLGTLLFCALGTLIGCRLGEAGGGLLCVSLHVVLSVLAGVFWPVSAMPGWMQAATLANPLRHLLEAVHQVQAGGAPGPVPVLALLGVLLCVSLALVVPRHRVLGHRTRLEVHRGTQPPTVPTQ
ncbi:ABC transporter permease [Streptomyces rimosus]|uniref:ABC transporter permease n=1 Tax=Streptomyces rimosus TaxID=1927 RepID=UPI0004C15A17|nr:ABC transporter permease [Streptomyces rimosus]